ncbi:lantibiotic dehydratase C-terminal domain-containing protein [Streptomyces sp. NPDC048172]|uniref:lantibiotic dehydratase C-terminal domain-containing protein n=1 Tax=Streptomyces sp. NPDC048172 TaxID=3365505 RepID=UPI00372181F0
MTAEPATPLNADDRDPGELRPGEWLSAHVYHAGDRDPLLVECVAPLFARLRAEGLADGCYFLRHWLEGPHLRLRIRPASDIEDTLPRVREEVETAVHAYLRDTPSHYTPESDLSDAQYRQRFLLEFSEEQWQERYGPELVRMPRRPNDSLAYVAYEPELERYGGPAGVELAEWQADRSGALVLELLESADTRVTSVRLGLTGQVMAALALGVLEDVPRTLAFLEWRVASWEHLFRDRHAEYEAAYRRMAPSLGARVEALYEGVVRGRTERLPGFVRRWAEHGAELRGRIDEAAERGELRFRMPDGSGGTAVRAVSARDARTALLATFTHMTCNRLGVTVGSEDYLGYVLSAAFRDRLS